MPSIKGFKPELKFDAQRAYRHITQLAFPRAVGSVGESRARAYIVEQLSAFGLRVDQETFRFTLFPAEILPRLIFAGFIGAVMISCWLSTSNPIFASLLDLSLLLIALLLTRWQKSLEWLYDIGKAHTSKNIVATSAPLPDAVCDLILVAHYDSKSQVLPIAVRALCYCIAVVGLIGLALLTGVQILLHKQLPSLLIWAVGSCVCCCLILLQFNFTQNRSPGALDNASGVGVLLELARCLTKHPLGSKIRLTFLSPGAEEYGMCGALRYIQRHAGEHDRNRTYVINLDGVGTIGKITLVTRYGIPPVTTSKRLGRAIIRSGGEIDIKVSEVYSPAGIGYDQLPIASRGFETVTISAGGFGGAALKIHSERDRIDLIDRGSLQQVGDLMAYFVTQIAKRKCGDGAGRP